MGANLRPSANASQIEDSIKNAGLRQVRQREAQLWQRASYNMTAQRYAEAQRDLRQLLALPEGGVHRDEAQRNLTDVIPKLQLQGKLLTQTQQALRQGDFSAARKVRVLKFSRAAATQVN